MWMISRSGSPMPMTRSAPAVTVDRSTLSRLNGPTAEPSNSVRKSARWFAPRSFSVASNGIDMAISLLHLIECAGDDQPNRLQPGHRPDADIAARQPSALRRDDAQPGAACVVPPGQFLQRHPLARGGPGVG